MRFGAQPLRLQDEIVGQPPAARTLFLLAVQKPTRRRQLVNVRGRSLWMVHQPPGIGADETVKASAFHGRFSIVPDGGVRVRIGPVTAKEPDIRHMGPFAGADGISTLKPR